MKSPMSRGEEGKGADTRHVIPFLTASRGSPDLQVPALATLLFVDQDCSCLQAKEALNKAGRMCKFFWCVEIGR